MCFSLKKIWTRAPCEEAETRRSDSYHSLPGGAGKTFLVRLHSRKKKSAFSCCISRGKKKILCNFRPQKSGQKNTSGWSENARGGGVDSFATRGHLEFQMTFVGKKRNARGFPPRKLQRRGCFEANMFFSFFDPFQTNIIRAVERVFSTHYSIGKTFFFSFPLRGTTRI